MTAPTHHDLAVVGLGPAGRALASAAAGLGLSVLAIDPRPDAIWSPTYGIWGDELGGLPESVVRARVHGPGLIAHGHHVIERDYLVLDNAALQAALSLEGVQVRTGRLDDAGVAALKGSGPGQASVVVDARGARPGGSAPEPNAAHHAAHDEAPAQTAYGIVVSAHDAALALDGAPALLMDWRTDWAAPGTTPTGTPTFLYAIPLGPDRMLLEETCLAAAPGMPIDQLRDRLRQRLLSRGVAAESVDQPLEREIVRIPMRGRDTPPSPGVLAIGTAGRGGHLVTGYSVAHALDSAQGLARAIADGAPPDRPDPKNAADLLREAGLRALLRLDISGTLDLFDAFGRLPTQAQRDFMSRGSSAAGMAAAMWGMFATMPGAGKGDLVAATLGPGTRGARGRAWLPGRLPRSSPRSD